MISSITISAGLHTCILKYEKIYNKILTFNTLGIHNLNFRHKTF